ncbi:amino acid ABC transporter permease [Desulforhabdus amnigena]|jgi:polar amino acid transport system permease protein|uniref:Amino acid ABC transporter permease n=1 Tax=Desulforhabdus amnigena TaxID=40218 RepID=A0A9W6FRU6_9BACT|nr:amino acid ABC transporter permease [Desulforhabdus amnigena]NLJ29822.1 amino acid ABC transporter permease [Deltaproteobacteria bacterium]GLI33902.1 amino acid ABC transporter permease [Desulforhabdus amnigena]
MSEGLSAVIHALPYMLQGSFVTVGIVVGAMLFGLALGVPLAVGHVYGSFLVKAGVRIYVWFFRGVPLLVLLFLFYFGFCSLLNINLSAFTVAVIVLGLISAAYQSQIFRGAIASMPAGQLKAAQALGMSDTQAVLFIILPQALRLSIPAWSNEYSIVLKDSAVAYALGVAEIMARTHFVATRTYQHLPLYIAAGMIYLILTYAGTKGLRFLESKTRIHGYSH